jgi:hypothetical protein
MTLEEVTVYVVLRDDEFFGVYTTEFLARAAALEDDHHNHGEGGTYVIQKARLTIPLAGTQPPGVTEGTRFDRAQEPWHRPHDC